MSRVLRGEESARAVPWKPPQVGADPAEGVHPMELPDVVSVGSRGEREPEPAGSSPEELETVRAEGFSKGLAQGREEGREEGRRQAAAELEDQLASLESVVGALFGYKRRLKEEAERETVELAFAVARRVVRRELSLDPSTAAGIVRACLDECAAAELERIVVNPADLEVVQRHVGDAGEVVPSEDVARGGALFETKQGRFDARIDSQLEEIENGLADG